MAAHIRSEVKRKLGRWAGSGYSPIGESGGERSRLGAATTCWHFCRFRWLTVELGGNGN